MTHDSTPGRDAGSSDSDGFGAGLTASQTSRSSAKRSKADPPDSSADEPRNKKKTTRRRRKPARAASADEGSPASDPSDAEDSSSRADTSAAGDTADGAPARKRRRGSRGGRRRKKATSASDEGGGSASDEAPAAEPAEADASASGDDGGPRKARRSRKRRARGEDKVVAEESEDVSADGESGAADDPDGDGPPKKKRRRGKRGGRRRKAAAERTESALAIDLIPGEDDDLPELLELPDEAELVAGGPAAGGKKKRQTKKKAKASGDKEKKKAAKPEPKRTGVILVNAHHTEEVRVAVVDDGRIVDLQMTVPRFSSYVNDIYRGRVVNLESAIGAAFVDFGQGRNGFLHASDVLPAYGEPDWNLEKLLTTQIDSDEFEDDDEPDESSEDADESADGEESGSKKKAKKKTKAKKAGRRSAKKSSSRSGRPRRPRLPIEKLLTKGQMTVCQITKDAIGDKGPTLTTYISIPGRYLVLMPSLARTGVSRKIEDEKERRRLKRILQSLEIPAGMGVIVRTAGVGKTKADIKRDLEYLLLAWDDFSRRLVSGRNPAPLYQESDVSVRTMRDLFTSTTEKVVVDDKEVYERMVAFTQKLMPENVDRIHLHEGSRPIFHAYGVEQDFEKIFQRRVELPSGGSIVIDQTEALVAIDVNSGRTRDDGADFEDIALKTNLEAAPEIARQIRLRDMGGIIVVDFIDMLRMSARRQVERAFRACLDDDRARSKVGRISQFGLLELTRQRLGPGLSKLIYDPCPRCRGTGRRRTGMSRTHAVLRRLGAAITMKGFTRVEVRSHPDVIQHLKDDHARDIDHLRESSGREIVLNSVPDQVEDSVLRYLRADGREVRPGGRRKR